MFSDRWRMYKVSDGAPYSRQQGSPPSPSTTQHCRLAVERCINQKDSAQNSHCDRMARVTLKPLIVLKIVARSVENWLILNIFQVATKSSDLVSKTWQTKLSLS